MLGLARRRLPLSLPWTVAMGPTCPSEGMDSSWLWGRGACDQAAGRVRSLVRPLPGLQMAPFSLGPHALGTEEASSRGLFSAGTNPSLWAPPA